MAGTKAQAAVTTTNPSGDVPSPRHGRPSSRKPPNERLTAWFARSGWSKGELARQVTSRAHRTGAPHISTDTSRVRRWLDGEQPREPIPRILSELFSERFGCVIGADDLGLREHGPQFTGSGVDLPWSPETVVEVLGEFTRGDLMLGRHGFLGATLALSAGPALVEPMQRWLVPSPVDQSGPEFDRGTVDRPVGAGGGSDRTVAATGDDRAGTDRPLVRPLPDGGLRHLAQAAALFRRWDMRCGGGLRRKAVVGQLHELTELLADATSAPQVRTELFRLTAEIAQTAGWMSYDVGMQPAAQKYFVLSLHAAHQAGDRALGAHALGLMARQMVHLGRAHDALDLVHLAHYGSRDAGGPRAQAMLHSLQARTHAALGEAERCVRSSDLAARLLDESPTAPPGAPFTDWTSYFDRAQLHAETGQAHRDLAYLGPAPDRRAHIARAQAELSEAVRLFRQDPGRRRALALAHTARAAVHLIDDAPHAACQDTTTALRLSRGVRSERLSVRLRRVLRDAVESHGEHPAVRELAGAVGMV